MSDFSDIKNIIDNNIFDNEEERISGGILNFILKRMLDVINSGKANIAANATSGHIAGLDGQGNPVDSGKTFFDYIATPVGGTNGQFLIKTAYGSIWVDAYTKEEVDAIVESLNNFAYEVVQTLPVASSSTMGKFYIYNGHIYVTSENNGTYSWTDLGNYSIDLTGYVTEEQLEEELANRPILQEVTKDEMEYMIENNTWEEGVVYYYNED